ncbi:MAG: nucleotide exchange factor GrpE [Elusimicrobia bacterium RIFCSPHIGHO2_02_FULL_57_9]|nr:MAG: nucleotide exchange factor GrpE [Elusimicrobia bacterium RIFCSPHIGHO2_02_FULL_57_9]
MTSELPPLNENPEGRQAAEPIAIPIGAAAKPAEPDYYNQLLKLKAEFENYRKRTDREKPEFYRMGKAEVLHKLLPIYDLLQRAHEQIQSSPADTVFAQGMDGIFKEFQKIFKQEGVTAMDPVGKPYNAQWHEVLDTADNPDFEEGAVVEVLQNGFMLQDKVLRIAKVRIARNKK